MTAVVLPPEALTGQRLLAATAPDLAAHQRLLGPLPWSGGPGRLIGVAEAAGLTGRGGAGFPTWRKLAAVATGDRPVVIGNAAEGEPASAKDRTLLGSAPHLVLDGLQLAAEAVGARRVYLYAPAALLKPARLALAERSTVDRLPVTVIEAPGTFISGEESAVIARVEGRPALPRDKPVRVVESGLRGHPTLVQNVETLAHLALLARYGPGWFRAQGTAEEPGTFLATLTGSVRNPGVYEAPYGLPLGQLLARAGGPTAPLQAILVGGYHGAWVPPEDTLRLSRAGLRPLGATPGAGVLVALPADACGLQASARIVAYLADQIAGQCGPCLNGLPALAGTLTRLARGGRDPRLPAEIQRLSTVVEGRGACHHPDGAARFIRSSLHTFADEISAHLAGHCRKAT